MPPQKTLHANQVYVTDGNYMGLKTVNWLRNIAAVKTVDAKAENRNYEAALEAP